MGYSPSPISCQQPLLFPIWAFLSYVEWDNLSTLQLLPPCLGGSNQFPRPQPRTPLSSFWDSWLGKNWSTSLDQPPQPLPGGTCHPLVLAWVPPDWMSFPDYTAAPQLRERHLHPCPEGPPRNDIIHWLSGKCPDDSDHHNLN